MSTRPLLLVLRALGLGDHLAGLPALRALADAFPDHHRVLAAPATLAPLAVHAGGVHDVAPTPGLVPLDAALRGPDVAVDLHGRGPGSQPLLLALQPRRLVAFRHPDIPDTAGLPEWRPGEHEVRRWCRLLEESGVPADPTRLDLSPPDLPVPDWLHGATIVHPGAGAPARRWPAGRFAEIAGRELAAGREVAITGSLGEVALARRVAAAAGVRPGAVLAGRLDLLELPAAVASAGRVVSGDTGIAHLAVAVGTPSVTLFGPIPPSEWGPPPSRSWHRALWAGRRGDPHGQALDPGLAAISVEEVREQLAALDGMAPAGAGRPGR